MSKQLVKNSHIAISGTSNITSLIHLQNAYTSFILNSQPWIPSKSFIQISGTLPNAITLIAGLIDALTLKEMNGNQICNYSNLKKNLTSLSTLFSRNTNNLNIDGVNIYSGLSGTKYVVYIGGLNNSSMLTVNGTASLNSGEYSTECYCQLPVNSVVTFIINLSCLGGFFSNQIPVFIPNLQCDINLLIQGITGDTIAHYISGGGAAGGAYTTDLTAITNLTFNQYVCNDLMLYKPMSSVRTMYQQNKYSAGTSVSDSIFIMNTNLQTIDEIYIIGSLNANVTCSDHLKASLLITKVELFIDDLLINPVSDYPNTINDLIQDTNKNLYYQMLYGHRMTDSIIVDQNKLTKISYNISFAAVASDWSICIIGYKPLFSQMMNNKNAPLI